MPRRPAAFPGSGAPLLALVAVVLSGLLMPATRAAAAEPWVLTEIGRSGTTTTVGAPTTLAECLSEQSSREEVERAYLRAANESDPRDQLPLPARSVTYRCLPDSGDRGGTKGR